MKTQYLLLALVGTFALILCPPAIGAAPADAAPAVETLTSQFESALATLKGKHEERVGALEKSYTAQLAKLQKEFTDAGDTDAAEATRRESEAVSKSPLAPEALAALPGELRIARQKYENALASYTANAAAQRVAPMQRFIGLLKDSETNFTVAGDLDSALAARKQRVARQSQLDELIAAAAAATAAKALPATAPAQRNDVKPVRVAARLAAKDGLKGAAENVYVFDAPRGSGRVGAKGLLYQSDADTGKGNTWRFTYRRGGHAQTMQIIHPHRDGQLVVHVSKSGAGLSSRSSWHDVGYGGGSRERMRRKREADTVFSLSDGKDFKIVSQLEPNGSYALFINGTLVVTSRASRVSPLNLSAGEGFKGGEKDFPLVWSPGWAGLIVGPIDKGENVCSEIEFAAGLLPVVAE